METKPRAKFCWECGRLLWGRRVHVVVEVHGTEVIVHKHCAEKAKSR